MTMQGEAKFLTRVSPRGAVAALMLGLMLNGVAAPAGWAQSATDIIDGSDPAVILSIAQGYGSAMLDVDAVGDPMITGRMGGQAYTVFFYGCEGGQDCTSIQFTTYFAGTRPGADVVSEWNDENRFGTLYLDVDGDLAIDLDVNLFGGVTRKNLDDTFDWWRVVLDGVRADLVE
jgi:hypothetical protein